MKKEFLEREHHRTEQILKTLIHKKFTAIKEVLLCKWY